MKVITKFPARFQHDPLAVCRRGRRRWTSPDAVHLLVVGAGVAQRVRSPVATHRARVQRDLASKACPAALKLQVEYVTSGTSIHTSWSS